MSESGRAKACEAAAVLAGDEYWCDRDHGHQGPHISRVHRASWGSSIQFEEKETAVIEEIDNDPFDAMRFAVDLHMHRNSSTVPSHAAIVQTRRHVLEDAEAILAWLRAKKQP